MRKIWNLPEIEFVDFTSTAVEMDPVLLVTSMPAWNAVKHKIHLPVCSRVEVTQATTDHWDDLLASVTGNQLGVIYAVGGGLVADSAKYMAVKLGLPLVCLPTALTVDAFLTSASGVRRDGCVLYLETKPPDKLLVDLEVLAAAPAWLRAAGITDVMSIATGAWDWKFADEHGRNPPGMEFISWVYANAQSILQAALDCVEAAGRGDPGGLKTLLDCLCMEVQLCNQIGHARPEEGSEHYFAYAVENFVGHGLPHADLVGPGILLAARLQGQATAPLENALRVANIPLGHIPKSVVDITLHQLPAYCRRHNLAFGIAHLLDQPG